MKEPTTGIPTGTVTFLFTDIEGSTSMWERDARRMQNALARHDKILKSTVAAHGGHVFKMVGDACCATFSTAPDALEAAVAAQRTIFSEPWEEGFRLRVRMALHTGAAAERGGDYFGPPLNRVARLLSAGHGGQILLSLPTQELVRDQVPSGAGLRDLGERHLKDLFRPERVFQLVAPGLPADFPPLRTLEGRPNNLPLQPTPLVGREREVAEVAGRLRGEGVRLLTLTGPGGTGKTRLGVQAAAELLEEFAGGAFFVALAPVKDPSLAASAIAGPLGVTESGERSLTEGLKAYLREKELLLVLDNFEQILDAAPLVGELLAAGPGLKVLATSRGALGLYGEHEYPVPPLSLPDPKDLPEAEALSQYEAVGLFVERAAAVKPGFRITNDSAPAVAEICHRLDGLPLAIELAAARVRILPPQAILKRLASRLKLLTGGARDLPARQQTLRGAIDWSHDLLDGEERMLFRRLAVFRGGRTIEAVVEVCDPEGDLNALDGLASLVDKGLLGQEEGQGGEPRFVTLETIHEYARERLEESGEAQEIGKRHAEYFLALAEEAEPEVFSGTRQAEWLNLLEAEHDNLRAALSWSLEREEAGTALRLAGALVVFWDGKNHFGEGRDWLELALAKNDRDPAAGAKALGGLGRLTHRQGDLDRAEEACEEGLELIREARDGSEAKVWLLLVSGGVALTRGDHGRATELFGESLALSQETGYGWGLTGSLVNLGIACGLRGDFERATELLEEGMNLCRERGNKQGLALCLLHLGDVAVSRGDLGRAAKLTEEGVALFRELGARGDAAYGLDSLGWMALLRNDLGRAASLYKESLAVAWDIGIKPLVVSALQGFAAVAGAQGEAERAARLWGAAEALHEAQGIPGDPDWLAESNARISAARSSLDEEAWEAAWAEGRAMTMEEAVSYALEETGA